MIINYFKKTLAFIASFKWQLLNCLFFLLIIFALLQPYLKTGFPYTHDGMNHLARFANYKIALKEGQLPPRFAPNLYNRYGYPVFNYNYPLANILSLPFSAIGLNYETTFKILVVLALIAMMVGSAHWLKSLKMSQSWLFSLAIFCLNPFLINLIYFRGNIGEIFALCLLPSLFASIEYLKSKTFNNQSLLLIVLVFSAFLLSHNIAVLFAMPLLLTCAFFKFKNNFSLWKKLGLVFLASIGFSLWFWLPALMEKSLVTLDNVSLSSDFAKHFPSLSQLLFAPLQFGFSYLGKIDTLSFALGLVQLLILLVLLITFIKQSASKKANYSSVVFYLFLALISIILQLSFTQIVWQHLPLSSYIQYPWRLSMFLAVLLIPLSANFFIEQKKFLPIIYFFMILQTVNLLKLKPVDFFHQTVVDYDAFSQSTSTLNENRVQGFEYQDFADWQPTAQIMSGEGKVIVGYWRGSSRSYQLQLQTEATIVEPTMKFLGWQTWANGNKLVYYDDEQIAGRLAYQLPAENIKLLAVLLKIHQLE